MKKTSGLLSMLLAFALVFTGLPVYAAEEEEQVIAEEPSIESESAIEDQADNVIDPETSWMSLKDLAEQYDVNPDGAFDERYKIIFEKENGVTLSKYAEKRISEAGSGVIGEDGVVTQEFDKDSGERLAPFVYLLDGKTAGFTKTWVLSWMEYSTVYVDGCAQVVSRTVTRYFAHDATVTDVLKEMGSNVPSDRIIRLKPNWQDPVSSIEYDFSDAERYGVDIENPNDELTGYTAGDTLEFELPDSAEEGYELTGYEFLFGDGEWGRAVPGTGKKAGKYLVDAGTNNSALTIIGVSRYINLLEGVKADMKDTAYEFDVETVPGENESTVTTVTKVNKEEGAKEADQVIATITTDVDKYETVDSKIWFYETDDEGHMYTGSHTYTGEAIKPKYNVYDGLRKLTEGSDYTVKYSKNTNVGTATATLNFKEGYKGSAAIKKTFTIDQADLTADATATDMSIAATGKLQKPTPDIVINASGKKFGKSLFNYTYKKEKDGEYVDVDGITEKGTYIAVIEPKKADGNFKGTAEATITVTENKTNLLSQAKVKLTKNKYLYTGEPVTLDPNTYTVTLNNEKLVEGTDYVITYDHNTEPGKATVIFTAKPENEKGLVGSKSETFTISKGRELKEQGEGSDFTYSYSTSVTYSKAGNKPAVVVKDNGEELKAGTDYTVSYQNNKNVAKAGDKNKSGKDIGPKIVLTGKGIYKGKVTLPFTITQRSITTLKKGISVEDKGRSNKGYKNPLITVKDGNTALKAAKEFEIDPESYKVIEPGSTEEKVNPDSAAVGSTVKVDIIGKGNYSERITVEYKYLEKPIKLSSTKAEKIKTKKYTGGYISLTVNELNKLLYTVKGNNKTYLRYKTDFKVVTYQSNRKAGTATVYLKGINGYSGLTSVKFKITPKK